MACLSDLWFCMTGPCSVKVMDCSSFSSSSVRVSGLVLDVPGTDMISEGKWAGRFCCCFVLFVKSR